MSGSGALELALAGYSAFVLVYFVALSAIYTLLFALSGRWIAQHLRTDRAAGHETTLRSPFTKPVSIVLPAYNESACVVESVYALLGLEYPELEVIVVNDGSTDDTIEQLREAFALRGVDRVAPGTIPTRHVRRIYSSRRHPELTVVDKENGGKSDAINAGINIARYPLLASLDADSIIERRGLLRAVRPFLDDPEQVIASGGIVRIVNGCRVESGQVTAVRLPPSRLVATQVIEYFRAFLAGRLGWSAINGLIVLSGAFSVYRRDILLGAGGLALDTLTEDAEVVVRLHAEMRRRGRPYRIVYVADPVAWTEAPTSFRVLRRQRMRWQRGLAEVLWRHRRTIGNPRQGFFGLVSMPYQLLFELLGPLVEATGYLAVGVAFAVGALNAQFFIAFVAIAFLYGVLLSIAALALEEWSFHRYERRRDVARLILYAVLENFGYRQLLSIWRAEAVLGALLRRRASWGEMKRIGFETGG